VLGDLLEAELLLGLGFEEGFGGCWKVGMLRDLWVISSVGYPVVLEGGVV
jgi:hypothetical protein